MVKPAGVVVKSLRDLEKYFCRYLPQSDVQMEFLRQLKDIFTTETSTTTDTRSIPNSASSPRVQMYAPVPRVLTRPQRVQNTPTPVPSLVVDYPQATKNNPPEALSYNIQDRAAQKCSISQDLML